MSTTFLSQGHRGARGLFPENTLPGFIEAIRLGVTTLELDVVVSADQQLVVSHEAWMNDAICSLPNGTPIENGQGKNYNLFRMTYAEIRQFDCGRRGHPEFPQQQALPAYKPLLSEVIAEAEAYTHQHHLPSIHYNIELKTEAEEGLFNPTAAVFAQLVQQELQSYSFKNRLWLQSFDKALLRELRLRDPALRIGLLVENENGLLLNIGELGFRPQAYNPEYVLVNESFVQDVHARGMLLIPWTVNDLADMQKLIAMGVDGIITDYPDRLLSLISP